MTLEDSAQIHSAPYNEQCNSGWGWQRIILLLIILQSIGIRALPMQGVVLGMVICLVLLPRIGVPIRQLLCFVVLTVIFISLSLRGMSSYSGIIFLTLNLVSAFFFVRYVETRWEKVEFDLLVITWWLSLHGLVSYLVYLVMPALFTTIVTGLLRYKVLGVFILSGWGSIRASGLCWEPGLLQYIANISLFLGIKHSWPPWKLAVSFLAVLATHSTTGIIALAPTMLYLLFVRRRSVIQWIPIVATITIVVILSVTLFQENIADKLSGKNTSGLVRLRDMNVGWQLILEKPLLGHGQFDEKYLVSNSKIWATATELFSKEFLASSGEFGGGYTNGFLALWAGYGIFIGAFIYWCFFNNRLIQGGFKERLTFFLISILTFISEPITNTSWFFFLAISGIYSRQLRENISANHKKLIPQKDRMVVQL